MRTARILALGFTTGLVLAGATTRGQAPPRGNLAPAAATPSVRVETAPLELIPPERFFLPVALEPVRRVALKATADGVVQALPARLGEPVRERQEVVQLERTEAAARLKIAQAEVKERQAALATVGTANPAIAQAQVEAAQARAELAGLALDRCTLRAPFAGILLAYPVSTGQYVERGETLAEVADVSAFRALVPVDRTRVRAGGTLAVRVEGKEVTAKVTAVVPLPESYAAMRALAAPWGAAWLSFDAAPGGGLEPGQRVAGPFLPESPVAAVPTRAVRGGRGSPESVQVIRNEYVVDVPVSVVGNVGPERIQVAGAFREGDAAVVEASVPLAAGTLIRFNGNRPGGLEGVPPDPNAAGAVAEVTRPSAPGQASTPPATRVAPIGAPDSAAPGRNVGRPAGPATKPAPGAPATKPGLVPF
jgi:multidrug efflux pump subunit AcrA (membrane-fusion protein)